MFIDAHRLIQESSKFKGNSPFDFCVIDDFFSEEVAQNLESEFLDYDDSAWFSYKNAIEDKKALNNWNVFPELTYNVFRFLTSEDFSSTLAKIAGVELVPDQGLHGGGWHIHDTGGNLNPHLDYSMHPKMHLQRKLNIIIYMSSELEEEHGGHLGLWEHQEETNSPGKLIEEIQPKFNRAVIFDTTQQSWHGMSRSLTQPKGIYRKSLAAYYLCNPPQNVDERDRALFAPRAEQHGDEKVEDLIKKRSSSQTVSQTYRDDSKS